MEGSVGIGYLQVQRKSNERIYTMRKDKSGLKWYGIIFLITLIVVLFVRSFLVQSYTVSSSQMETALLRGDRLLVDKTTYGIRMPITLLTLPFTFDTFLGFKSYSNLIQLNYNRLFAKRIERNDIVLFNNPAETDKPIDKRSLTLSRCVGIPGDTIEIKENEFYINENKYIPSPDLLMTFRFPIDSKDSITSVMNLFDIPVRSSSSDSLWEYVSLNRYEVFILNQKLPAYLQLKENVKSSVSYKLIVPRKGSEVQLTDFSIALYHKIIQEEDKDVVIINGRMMKDGKVLNTYRFTDDYYWFVSDNPDAAADSRSLGFISEKFIIGKASFLWYSPSNENRSFSSIK